MNGETSDNDQLNVIVKAAELDSLNAQMASGSHQLLVGNQIILADESSILDEPMENMASLEEFITYHNEETKVQKDFTDYLSRLHAIQHKRAEVLNFIFEEYFKNEPSFKFKYLIEDLEEDYNTLILENPQMYEDIVSEINTDLIMGEDDQFRFIEDNVCIINESHRRLAKKNQNILNPHSMADLNSVFSFQNEELDSELSALLTCPACGLTLSNGYLLKEHVKDVHFDNPFVVCAHEGCEESFHIQNFAQHQQDYHPQLAQVCDLCNTNFDSKARLYEHLRDHSNGVIDLKCDFPNCSFHDPSPHKMLEHKLSEHNHLFRKVIRCPVAKCGKAFPDAASYQAHTAQHDTKSTILTYSCNYPGCKSSFRRRRNLESHRLKHEDLIGAVELITQENEENFNHSDTPKMEYIYSDHSDDENDNFPSSAELYDIKESVTESGDVHREILLWVNKGQPNEALQTIGSTNPDVVTDFVCGEKTLTNKCDLCNVDFGKTEEMINHLKTRHHQYTIKGYRCDQCSFVTHFRSLLGKHKNSLHGGKYKCEHCGKLSKDSGNHNRHRNIHKNIVFRCTIDDCHAVYKSMKAYNVHVLSHSNAQPIYYCDFPECKYVSNYQNAIKVHKLTHTDTRNFVCPFEPCQKGFKRNGDLNKHINHSHKGEKRQNKNKKHKIDDPGLLYRCSSPGCGYTCVGSNDVVEHEAMHAATGNISRLSRSRHDRVPKIEH